MLDLGLFCLRLPASQWTLELSGVSFTYVTINICNIQ